MILTLTVPRPPQRPAPTRYESRGDEIVFADGYRQAGGPVNAIDRTVEAAWRLGVTDAAALVAFLEARRGVERFLYTMPGESPAAWVARSWSVVWEAYDARTVTATLEARVVLASDLAPGGFAPGGWDLAPAATPAGNALSLTLIALPPDGGAPITAIEYRVNGGAPVTETLA